MVTFLISRTDSRLRFRSSRWVAVTVVFKIISQFDELNQRFPLPAVTLRVRARISEDYVRRYSLLLVILGSILWGTDSLFRRPLSQGFSPITIVLLEHCILSLVLLPTLLRSRNLIPNFNSRDWIAMIFIALGGSVAATSLFTYSIKYGNPSVTVLLQKTQPFFTLTLARWMLRERPGIWFWYCLIPAIGGAYLVSTPNWQEGFRFNLQQPACILAALAASFLWGTSTVLGRYIVARVPILMVTALRFILALPVLLILFWFQPAADRVIPGASASIAALIAMALIPGFLALVFYYRGLRWTTASIACFGEMAFPLTAVLTNWYILDVRLTGSQVIGGCILVATVAAVSCLNARRRGE